MISVQRALLNLYRLGPFAESSLSFAESSLSTGNCWAAVMIVAFKRP
jgi:hypothetical protein